MQPAPHISNTPLFGIDKEAGFSLLEILAALVIIALMSTAVALSLKPPVPTESDQRDAFTARLNQAAKNSVYTGRVHALSVSTQGFALMRYQEGGWAVIEEFPALSRKRVQLHINNEKVTLPESASPLILFEPTGEITDFTLNLRGVDLNIDLYSAEDGHVKIGKKRS